LVFLTFFFGDWLIQIAFGDKYMPHSNLLMIFMIGISGAFLFRVPFGNIMVAIGWTKINTVISIVTLIADVILNYFWIHKWGIMGAAYATSLLLWLSGIATFIVFIVYLSRLEK
jgi:O-antigen/teichoic acid export membrane protein